METEATVKKERAGFGETLGQLFLACCTVAIVLVCGGSL